MGIIKDCINNKKTDSITIWLMRQAGRYLPEFRKIRSRNENFINLCLNPQLSNNFLLPSLSIFTLAKESGNFFIKPSTINFPTPLF